MKIILCSILVFLLTFTISANVASPSQGGQTLSEPSGISKIDILKEELNIDFTQLGDENLKWNERFVNVDAVYQIENPTDVPKLDLVFVIVSDSKNFQFFVDDKEIASEPIDNKEFSDKQSWKKPDKTPFEDRELMYSPYNGVLKSAKFSINLPKGKHFLRAKYKSQPTVYSNLGVLKGWQFAYSLAPARDWKSFGGLNLNVKIPTDWRFFSNLKLEQNGELLTGNFKEIPADFFAVTTQAPLPPGYKSWAGILDNLFIGSLFIFPILFVLVAFWKGYKWKYSWLYGGVWGFIWAMLVGTVGFLSGAIPKSFIPAGQYSSYGYDGLFETFFLVLLIPITLVIGIIIWVVSIWLAGKLRK